MRLERGTLLALAAGGLSALAASLCCVAPLILVGVGLGGAWVSTLTAMEPYRPLFAGLTLALLGVAFYRLYLSRTACAPGAVCSDPATRRRHRTIFWGTSATLAVLLAVPYAGFLVA
jgi:mercuric ion transport protein